MKDRTIPTAGPVRLTIDPTRQKLLKVKCEAGMTLKLTDATPENPAGQWLIVGTPPIQVLIHDEREGSVRLNYVPNSDRQTFIDDIE